MHRSIDDESLLAFCQYLVPNESCRIRVARAHGRPNVVATGRGPVERRFAEPNFDPSVRRQRLVYIAHGGIEFGETDQCRRRSPAHRVVPDSAELDVGNGLTGHVAVDHLLLAAGAELDHHIANVTRKARVPHDCRVKLHLLGEPVGVAQGYDRVIAKRPEHAVERWLDDHVANACRLIIGERRDLGMARRAQHGGQQDSGGRTS
jgi:hypothetical protein